MKLKSFLVLAAVAVFGLMILWTPQAFGQAVYGSIFGTITDNAGAVVPGATVTVSNVQKGTSVVAATNETGNYSVQHLIPDVYKVTVESPNFAKVESANITISADTSQRFDAKLGLASVQQSVVVTAETPQLKTDRADVATIFNEKATEDLPIFNRNFTNFELLTPGTTRIAGWAHASTENPQGSQQIFVNGQGFGGTSWQLDGTDNRDPVLGIIIINPNLDAVTETKITTQNYDAEFGNAVAGVITAQTKSGGNALHGSAFWFRRGGDQQARDPFTQFARDPVTGRFIPPTLWNQFGGSVGGPIIKDKLFFFGDYQGTRQKVGNTVQASVPTQLVRNTCLAGAGSCDLSEYLGGGQNQVYDPSSGGANGIGRAPFAGNLIPVGRLSQAAVGILNLLPAPNAPGTSTNYTKSGTGGFNNDQFDVRLDDQVSQTLHAFGRYTFFNSRQSGGPAFGAIGGPGFGAGGFAGKNFSRDHSVAIGLDYVVSNTLVTDLRGGWFQYYVHNLKFDQGVNAASALGLNGLNTGSFDTSGLPTFIINGIQTFGDNVSGCNCPLTEMEHQFQIANNWTKTIRNHSVKFGADVRLAQNLRSASDSNRTGILNFSQAGTELGTGGGGAGGLGLATFLLGDVTSFNRFVVSNNHAGEHQKRIFFYAQDSWRITPKLTLNYGLRWEDIFPETVTINGEGGFVNLRDGFLHIAGVGGIPTNGGQNNNLNHFAPRLAVAYSPNERTVIRLGYGRSFDEGVFGSIFGTALTHNIPVVANQALQGASAFDAAFALAGGPVPFVSPTIPTNGLIPLQNDINYPSVRPSRMRLPTVDMWNLSVQQQLAPSLSLELAYVGNKGLHVYPGDGGGYNFNQPAIGPGPQQTRRPLFNRFVNGSSVCCNTDLALVSPDANNHYNSLQVRLDKRFSKGLQFGAFYTWSRALGYSDDYFDISPRANYGRNDWNRDQNFVLNLLYELPFGKGKQFGSGVSRWSNAIIGGWQLNTVTNWASGIPFTPSYSECGNDRDTGPCRPDLALAGSFQYGAGSFDPVAHTVTYFTPVAPLTTNGAVSGPFRRPQQFTFGNIGRNSATGPAFFGSDMSVFKSFVITEKMQVQFRFDAFNVFNHPVLNVPNNCVDCTTGLPGKITSLEPDTQMRRLQFGIRATF